MTLTTFQKLLTELLAQYNEEAENHDIEDIKIHPMRPPQILQNPPARVMNYQIEIKTLGK